MDPRIFAFDIFGTVLDWRTGLGDSLKKLGRELGPGDFDKVIDAQGADEQGPYLTYRDITVRSLTKVLGLSAEQAGAIGESVGRWPLFADSRAALKRLMGAAPCVAMSNSDRLHADQVQEQLGFRLSDWVSAEEARLYKPAPEFWRLTAKRRSVSLDRSWWHVSAYADYDLRVARELGLTCIFVSRGHSRPGWAHHTVKDLNELADLIEA